MNPPPTGTETERLMGNDFFFLSFFSISFFSGAYSEAVARPLLHIFTLEVRKGRPR